MSVRHEPGARDFLAPAKLNLFLEILGKRPDGYHELETLMVAIDLHDRLSFRPDESGEISLSCDDPSLPVGSENLVVRAAERLREEAAGQGASPLGVSIALHKSIPAQAGLGGGSSDAATTLMAMNQLWGLGVRADRLAELAGELGSDVPFFLGPKAAICEGRGERIRPIGTAGTELPTYWFVLVCPPTGVRTADVYGRLSVPRQAQSIDGFREAYLSGDPERLGACLHNRLQPVAEQINPALRRVREALEHLGPSLDGTLMSGSGSAYFGLARDREAATGAANRLADLGLGRLQVVRCGP